jgi:hypothetical protein
LNLMQSFVRFLVRLLLVPLGALLAIFCAALVLVVAHWGDFATLLRDRPDVQGYWALVVFVLGPMLALLLAVGVMYVVVPGSIGVLLSEAFAIRSWMFHIANGGLSAWIGRYLLLDIPPEYHFLLQPTIIIASGFAAGGAYWLVAGWSAGFWKPIFGPLPPPAPPPLLPAP